MEISTVTLSLFKPTQALAYSSSRSSFFNPAICSKKFSCSSLVVAKRRGSRKGFSCNAVFGLGVPELVVIAGVAALVFGPKNLPEVGKNIGKTVKSFQQAAKEFESELKKEPETPSEELPTSVSEEDKQDAEVSSSKETV